MLTGAGPAQRADLPAFWCCGLFGEFDGDGFEFGDELAQAAVGGEVGAEPLGGLGGEGLGDGAGAGFAGLGGVRTVEDGRAGVAVAARPLAAGGAAGERAGQGDADMGKLGLDLLVAAGQVVHHGGAGFLIRHAAASPGCMLRSNYISSMPRLPRGRYGGRGPARLPAGNVTAPALRGLSRFADTWGVPRRPGIPAGLRRDRGVLRDRPARPGVLDPGAYRSALYRLAEAACGPPGQRPTPFPGARAPAPYSPGEQAELAAVAAASAIRRNVPRRWRWWCSASAPGCGPASW